MRRRRRREAQSANHTRAHAIEIVRFEVTKIKLPATCYVELVTAGAGGSTALKQLKLSQQYVTSAVLKPLYICFGISMLVAFLTWVIAAARLGAVCLNFKLGSPAWDFAKSWTTNTTLAGAVISTALTLGALPELTQMPARRAIPPWRS